MVMHDSIIIVATPWSGNSKCPAALCHAAVRIKYFFKDVHVNKQIENVYILQDEVGPKTWT